MKYPEGTSHLSSSKQWFVFIIIPREPCTSPLYKRQPCHQYVNKKNQHSPSAQPLSIWCVILWASFVGELHYLTTYCSHHTRRRFGIVVLSLKLILQLDDLLGLFPDLQFVITWKKNIMYLRSHKTQIISWTTSCIYMTIVRGFMLNN